MPQLKPSPAAIDNQVPAAGIQQWSSDEAGHRDSATPHCDRQHCDRQHCGRQRPRNFAALRGHAILFAVPEVASHLSAHRRREVRMPEPAGHASKSAADAAW